MYYKINYYLESWSTKLLLKNKIKKYYYHYYYYCYSRQGGSLSAHATPTPPPPPLQEPGPPDGIVKYLKRLKRYQNNVVIQCIHLPTQNPGYSLALVSSSFVTPLY